MNMCKFIYPAFLMLLMAIVVTPKSVAQTKTPTVKAEFGKGIQFASADSSFTLTINGRIQSLFEAKSDLDNNTTGADFLIRRCRLNFQGSAFSPQFSYRIQIGFAQGDITASNSASQNNLILRDAMLFYQPHKWLRIGFGQTKLPGNRQRQVSSANLQLVERSIANNNFTLDRDKGIWVYNHFDLKKAVVKSTIAISSGEGRIVSAKNGKLSYAARLEVLPFGEFAKNGDYIESDQEKEARPKLSVAGAYSFNNEATRTMGQLGEFLYNSETSDIRYYGGDIMFKYRGFSLESELYKRHAASGIITNQKDTTEKNYVVAGTTFMVQSGYFLTRTNEVALRYAQIIPDAKVSSLMQKQHEYVAGFSHYFQKHNLKLQTDLSYLKNGSNESLVYRLSGVVTF